MFAFSPVFSREDVRRVGEKMNSNSTPQLSDRTRKLLTTVQFSSGDLVKATSGAVLENSLEQQKGN